MKNNLKNVDNKVDKENCKQIVNPIVPVAQFEAFKVYEDRSSEMVYTEEMRAIDEKHKGKMKNKRIGQVYKEDANKLHNKVEIDEIEKFQNEDLKREVSDSFKDLSCLPKPSPMSVEKILNDSSEVTAEDLIIRGIKSGKDIFFDMEEYRADIYAYLREHEVKYYEFIGKRRFIIFLFNILHY